MILYFISLTCDDDFDRDLLVYASDAKTASEQWFAHWEYDEDELKLYAMAHEKPAGEHLKIWQLPLHPKPGPLDWDSIPVIFREVETF